MNHLTCPGTLPFETPRVRTEGPGKGESVWHRVACLRSARAPACPAGAARCSSRPPHTPTRSWPGSAPRLAAPPAWPRRSPTPGPAASRSRCWPTRRRPRSAWRSPGSCPGGRGTRRSWSTWRATRSGTGPGCTSPRPTRGSATRSAAPSPPPPCSASSTCAARGTGCSCWTAASAAASRRRRASSTSWRSSASTAAASPCCPGQGPGSTPTKAGRSSPSCRARCSPRASRSGSPRAPRTPTGTGSSPSRRPTTTPTAT